MDETPLLQRLRAGDMSALESLYRAHFSALCRYATRLTGSATVAEEVVEDVFLRVWEKRRQLAIRTSMRAYLFGAVRRECLLHHRTEANRERLVRAAADGVGYAGMPAAAASPEAELEAAELADLMRAALAALPERPREAFGLKRGHGMSQAEIAETMGIAESTVEKHLARAMEALRDALERWRQDTPHATPHTTPRQAD